MAAPAKSAPDGAPRDFVFARPQADSGFDLCLFTRREEPRLRPRREATATRAVFPGTAVRYRDEIYEVRAVAPVSGEYPFRHDLTRFDAGMTVRTVLDLDPEGAARYQGELRDERARRSRLGRLSLLLPLTGLLPAHRLQALREELGLAPRRAVIASALLLLLPSIPIALYGVIAAIAMGEGGGIDPRQFWIPPIWLQILAGYLATESAVRMVSQDLMGSLPVAIAVALLEETGLMTRVATPEARRREREAERSGTAHLVDRVQRLPAPGGTAAELRIESALAKEWPEGACIRYQDRFYVVADHGEERRQAKVVHRYRLVEADEMARARQIILYRPDEELLRKRDEERRDFGGRLQVLKPFAGFLPGTTQERFARDYEFDAHRATLMSAWIEIVLAVSQGVAAVMEIHYLQGHRWAPLVLLASLVFALEGVLRLEQLRRTGRPSGTFLLAMFERR